MPLVLAPYNPTKMLFALKPETFTVRGFPNDPDNFHVAFVEAIFTHKLKSEQVQSVGTAHVFFELDAARWGRVKVADFTYEKFLAQRFKGKLNHALLTEWDGAVLDTFGRRERLSVMQATAAELHEPLMNLGEIPAGTVGWYSQRA